MSVSNQPKTALRFGIFEFDAEAGELRRNGMKVRLAGQPIEILAMLLERPGRVVTREELRARLWPADTFVEFEHSLNAAVMRLRQALGDDADTPKFVETLPRRGYRFLGNVDSLQNGLVFDPAGFVKGFNSAIMPVVTPDSFSQQTPFEAAARRRMPALRLIAAIFAFIVLSAGLFVGWRVAHRGTAITSLAVLPLANFSADPEQEFFADGMTEELTTDLSKIEALRVISRTSVMHYKGTKQSLPEIARELNVDAIIEGSVQREAERVRIVVQLVQAANERHLWSGTYDREVRDILSLRADIARDVAEQVRAKLSAPAASRIRRSGTTNLAAYEAFLRGRHFFDRRDYADAVRELERAVELDPNYALAYAYLAEVYGMLNFNSGGPFGQKQDAAGSRACQLDSELAECHMFKGDVALFRDWNWQEGVAELRRAVELDPGSSLVRIHYGISFSVLGDYERGLEETRGAELLDPLSPNILSYVGTPLLRLGRYEEARAQFEKIIELDPAYPDAYFSLGDSYRALGQPDKAFSAYIKGLGITGSTPGDIAGLQRAYAAGGMVAFQKLRWQQQLARAQSNKANSLEMARIFIALGNRDQAIGWLQKAHEERLPAMVSLKAWVFWDPLRSDPRFQEIVRKMNFPN